MKKIFIILIFFFALSINSVSAAYEYIVEDDAEYMDLIDEFCIWQNVWTLGACQEGLSDDKFTTGYPINDMYRTFINWVYYHKGVLLGVEEGKLTSISFLLPYYLETGPHQCFYIDPDFIDFRDYWNRITIRSADLSPSLIYDYITGVGTHGIQIVADNHFRLTDGAVAIYDITINNNWVCPVKLIDIASVWDETITITIDYDMADDIILEALMVKYYELGYRAAEQDGVLAGTGGMSWVFALFNLIGIIFTFEIIFGVTIGMIIGIPIIIGILLFFLKLIRG